MSLVVNDNGITYDLALPKAIVMYRYEATEEEEISLEEGSYIDIVEEASDGWWRGFTISKDRKEGIFPFNYVRKLSKNETEAWKQKMFNGNSSSNSSISINKNSSSNSNSSINKNSHSNSSLSMGLEQAQQSTLRDSSTSNSSSTSLNQNHQYNQQSDSTTSLPALEPSETHYIASLSDPIEKSQPHTEKRMNSLPPVPTHPAPLPPTPTQPAHMSAPLPVTPLSSSPSSSPSSPAVSSLSSSPTSPSKITITLDDVSKEGYLTKKGHIRRNWNIRWFRLRRNILTYTKTPTDPKISGELHLTPDTQVDIATSMKRTNCFMIRIPNHMNSKSELSLACSANSPTDMEEWINAINQAKTKR